MIDQAREDVVRGQVPARVRSEIGVVRRERIGEVQLAGAEILIFHARIEVRGQRITQAGDALICPGIVLVAREPRPRAAGAAPDVSAEASAEVAVEQRIGHQLGNTDMATHAEVIGRDGRPRSGAHIGQQRARDAEAFHLRSLVSALGFEPKQSQLVTGDQVDVVADLVLDSVTIVVGRACRAVGDGHVILVRLWERDAALQSHVRTVGRCPGGSRENGCSRRRQYRFAHG